jgi:hypothetical protein
MVRVFVSGPILLTSNYQELSMAMLRSQNGIIVQDTQDIYHFLLRPIEGSRFEDFCEEVIGCFEKVDGGEVWEVDGANCIARRVEDQ